MANKKISELGVLSTVAGADFLAVVDDTDSTTKQLTVTNLMAAAPVQTADISSFITGVTAGELGDFDFDDNAILGFSASTNDQTGTTYTVAASDNGKVVVLNNASAITVDIDTWISQQVLIVALYKRERVKYRSQVQLPLTTDSPTLRSTVNTE